METHLSRDLDVDLIFRTSKWSWVQSKFWPTKPQFRLTFHILFTYILQDGELFQWTFLILDKRSQIRPPTILITQVWNGLRKSHWNVSLQLTALILCNCKRKGPKRFETDFKGVNQGQVDINTRGKRYGSLQCISQTVHYMKTACFVEMFIASSPLTIYRNPSHLPCCIIGV